MEKLKKIWGSTIYINEDGEILGVGKKELYDYMRRANWYGHEIVKRTTYSKDYHDYSINETVCVVRGRNATQYHLPF